MYALLLAQHSSVSCTDICFFKIHNCIFIAKYNCEFKKEIVKAYLNGEGGFEQAISNCAKKM
ncbi:MAG: hypothetical protein RR654_01400 [Oscillospiraceae bacterium]